MPDTGTTTGATTNRSSKNTTPTGRSSGTGSNSSTNTPSTRRKKNGGDHHESGSGGIAGLFASLCGGSKAKKAFDDPESTAGRNTTANLAATVRRPSQSKALPAAPITTKEVGPDVEVSTTKRLSTTETGPSPVEEGSPSSAIGDPSRGALAGGDPTRTAPAENPNGDTPFATPQNTSDKLKSGRQMLSTEDSGIDRFTANPAGSKSLAPVVLGAGAVGLSATALQVSSNGTSRETRKEIGDSTDSTDRQNVAAVTHQFDKDMVFNDTLISTGHPLPLDEVCLRDTPSPLLILTILMADRGHDICCCSASWIGTHLCSRLGTPRSSPSSDAPHHAFGNSGTKHSITVSIPRFV